VRDLLADPRLLGHHQFHRFDVNGKRLPVEEVIKDYYPCVIDTALWQQVYEMRQRNSKRDENGGGNTFMNNNLFVLLARCAHCGGPLHYANKTSGGYLKCHNKIVHATDQHGNRLCTGPNFKYQKVVNAVFTRFKDLDIEALMPTKDQVQNHIEALNAQLASGRLKPTEYDTQIGNLTLAIGLTTQVTARAHIVAHLEAAIEDRKVLEKRMAEFEGSLRSLRKERTQLKQTIQANEELHQLLEVTPDSELPSLGKRINSQLRSWLDHITVHGSYNPKTCLTRVTAVRLHSTKGYSESLITDWVE